MFCLSSWKIVKLQLEVTRRKFTFYHCDVVGFQNPFFFLALTTLFHSERTSFVVHFICDSELREEAECLVCTVFLTGKTKQWPYDSRTKILILVFWCIKINRRGFWKRSVVSTIKDCINCLCWLASQSDLTSYQYAGDKDENIFFGHGSNIRINIWFFFFEKNMYLIIYT